MPTKEIIPEYPLLNAQKIPVQMDVNFWGKTQSYDYLEAHRHHFHEILFFTKGGGVHDIDFQTYNAQKGSVHFVLANAVHLLKRENESEGFSLVFTQDFLSYDLTKQLPFHSPKPFLQLNEEKMCEVIFLVNSLKDDLLKNDRINIAIRLHTMEIIVLKLIQCVELIIENESSFHSETIHQFQQLIQHHYKEKWLVEKYANTLNISTKHLIDLCKKHTGKTPLQLMKEQIISEAKRLLFHTQLSIKEIAYELEFDDPAYFSKSFRQSTGYSPEAYRKNR